MGHFGLKVAANRIKTFKIGQLATLLNIGPIFMLSVEANQLNPSINFTD